MRKGREHLDYLRDTPSTQAIRETEWRVFSSSIKANFISGDRSPGRRKALLS